MSGIYARGCRLWCRLKEDGRWTSKATPFNVGDEDKARRYARAAQERIDARAPGEVGPATVTRFAERWYGHREQLGVDWKKDRGILCKHVLPVIGALPISDVRPVHIVDIIRRVRGAGLAARTVHNVYTSMSALFRDAALEGAIEQTPCILTHHQLGPIVDKDPEWRAGAVFDRDEAEVLISHTGIPMDRRLVYGFGLLAGLRPGEVGAARWRNYDAAATPLGRLVVAVAYSSKRDLVKGTKTQAVRHVPVHQTLAAMLAEWKLGGWPAMFGRAPGPDDLIVPLPPETVERRKRAGEPMRGDRYTYRRWVDIDLPMLGWRHRAAYATKSTFITLAIEDGADAEILEQRVTHTKPRRSAFAGYDRGPHWIEACAEVAKLRLTRRGDNLRILQGGQR
jgi:integrase